MRQISAILFASLFSVGAFAAQGNIPVVIHSTVESVDAQNGMKSEMPADDTTDAITLVKQSSGISENPSCTYSVSSGKSTQSVIPLAGTSYSVEVSIDNEVGDCDFANEGADQRKHYDIYVLTTTLLNENGDVIAKSLMHLTDLNALSSLGPVVLIGPTVKDATAQKTIKVTVTAGTTKGMASPFPSEVKHHN